MLDQQHLLPRPHPNILLTFTKQPPTMTVEIKGLDGSVLDRKSSWEPRNEAQLNACGLC